MNQPTKAHLREQLALAAERIIALEEEAQRHKDLQEFVRRGTQAWRNYDRPWWRRLLTWVGL